MECKIIYKGKIVRYFTPQTSKEIEIAKAIEKLIPGTKILCKSET